MKRWVLFAMEISFLAKTTPVFFGRQWGLISSFRPFVKAVVADARLVAECIFCHALSVCHVLCGFYECLMCGKGLSPLLVNASASGLFGRDSRMQLLTKGPGLCIGATS